MLLKHLPAAWVVLRFLLTCGDAVTGSGSLDERLLCVCVVSCSGHPAAQGGNEGTWALSALGQVPVPVAQQWNTAQ